MTDKNVLFSLDVVCCNGCGGCAEMCPEVFGFDDTTDKAYPRSESGPEDCVLEAANLCPLDCIEIEE